MDEALLRRPVVPPAHASLSRVIASEADHGSGGESSHPTFHNIGSILSGTRCRRRLDTKVFEAKNYAEFVCKRAIAV